LSFILSYQSIENTGFITFLCVGSMSLYFNGEKDSNQLETRYGRP